MKRTKKGREALSGETGKKTSKGTALQADGMKRGEEIEGESQGGLTGKYL